MNPSEKKYFADDNSNGLNADDAQEFLQPNQWVNLENFRSGSTDKGVTGVLESIGGTLLKSTPSPSVSFIEIGNIIDTVGQRIIYFYYNLNTTQHKIEAYSYQDDTTYLMVVASQITGGLNFNKNYPIHGRVINGVAYWTDNYNAPRKINIDAAIKTNNPSYSTDEAPYTIPIESDVISLIRRPPFYALQASKTTLGTVTVNNIADFAGQFAWRFVFRDNEVSVLSPISELINYNGATDTTDAVIVGASDIFGNPQPISQDVQVVDFCVRYAGDPSFYIIKSWDKRIAADAADIALQNAGISSLTYTFLNDRVGIALSDAYSVKPFDSVPRVTKTLETGLNRLLLGHNLESFDTPVLSSLAASLVPETNRTPFQNPSFKSGSTYQIGIIFRDYYKRVIGNVFTNDSMRLYVPDRDYNLTTYQYYLNWTLSNAAAADEIPDTAYYYEIVMTKNLVTRFFVQANSEQTKYAIKNPETGLITYQASYSANAYGIALDATSLNTQGMGYSFQEGDIVKLWLSNSATVYSLAVVGQDGNYIISKLANVGNFIFGFGPEIIYEIYSPYKENASEAFWTTGDTLLITNPTESGRTYSSITGSIYGDIYITNRIAISGSYVAENMSPNVKFWNRWNVNAGEANFVINSEQVTKYTSVRWSNVIIEGSQTNGLSTFDALDEKILPADLGKLSKLQQTSKVEEQGNIVLAIGEQETASCYLGETQLVGAAANAFVATSPNVIGTVNVLKGSFGTVNPESVTEYRGNVYWLDMNNGRVIQYSANGLFPISNYKTQRFWKNWCEQFQSLTAAEIEELGGRPFVFATVDPFHDELLIATPRLSTNPPKGFLPNFNSVIDFESEMVYPFDILDYQAKTMVYDLMSNTWRGSYSFCPEGFATLQNQLYSFKNGQLYLHNQANNQCNFYGEQFKAKVMPVSNMFPSVPKVYNAIAIESNVAPNYVYFYNDYPYQQISDLVDYQFRSLEGVWNAAILRNIIQPTATGNTVDSRLTGEKMRNVAMWIMVEFAPTGSNVTNLKYINIQFTPSTGNVNV